jgi:8-oxo-dGTP pyrophosphatase MutT (NUDIX family)
VTLRDGREAPSSGTALRDGREAPSSGNGSLHADALAVLQAWAPPSAEQAALRDRYVAHLESAPDGLRRTCYPDHLTASTLVLSADGERVLLTLHAKAQRWFQLGGHSEPGDETLAGAAEREAVEESGLAGLRVEPTPVQLSEHAVPFCDTRGGVHHLDVRFLAVADDGAEPVVSDESLDVRWWPVDALPDDDLADLVALALRRCSAAQSTSSPGGGSSLAAADQPSR